MEKDKRCIKERRQNEIGKGRCLNSALRPARALPASEEKKKQSRAVSSTTTKCIEYSKKKKQRRPGANKKKNEYSFARINALIKNQDIPEIT